MKEPVDQMAPDPSEPGRTDRPPLPRPVLPLDYGTPWRASPGRWAFTGRMLAGAVGYIVISVAWLRYGARSRLPARTMWGGWLAMTGVLLAVSLYVRVRHKRAGYGYGILLALGMAVLLVGGVVLLIISACGHGGRI